MRSTIIRWGLEDLAPLTRIHLDEAREILIEIRDKSISMLSTFFGDAEIVVEAEYTALDEPEKLNEDKKA